MAVSRALRRLLRIRDLEEEQHRLFLESAMGQMQALESALVDLDLTLAGPQYDSSHRTFTADRT